MAAALMILIIGTGLAVVCLIPIVFALAVGKIDITTTGGKAGLTEDQQTAVDYLAQMGISKNDALTRVQAAGDGTLQDIIKKALQQCH